MPQFLRFFAWSKTAVVLCQMYGVFQANEHNEPTYIYIHTLPILRYLSISMQSVRCNLGKVAYIIAIIRLAAWESRPTGDHCCST